MRFPDCKIHRMPQRSPDWHEVRKGKMTATGMGSWLTERPECRYTVAELRQQIQELVGTAPPAKLKRDELLAECKTLGINLPKSLLKATEDARITALAKLIGSLSACEVPDEWQIDPEGPAPKSRQAWLIWNGMVKEPEAVARFEEDTGLEIEEVGFCEHHSGMSGCSPDGLIVGENVGFEGKVPHPDTHAKYLLRNELPPEYRDQVHGSMAVTGADAWWFQSYCPGAIKEVFRIKVERDEYTEAMETGLQEFAEFAKQKINQLLK